MHQFKSYLDSSDHSAEQRPVWRRALISLFGAAHRLHQYRDARDVLLQSALCDQERRRHHQTRCDEPC
jgi:hypothetical protein